VAGQTISHYRIVEKLGEGGMGVVYKAVDTKLERLVALKLLPAHLLGNEDIRRRFEPEAKSAAALDHPNVCHVHEIDDASGRTFISMSLIEGESLDKKIATGPLKLDEALSIAQQIAKGLEAAHKRGIIRRDIKTENIMVGEDGHVTIMDFGLAQLTEASRLTRTDETMGTVAYMSPEQTEGSGTDRRTDIWSLGVVLFEMVTGQQPFKGDYDKAVMYSILNEEPEPITALRTGVPMELELLVNKCLAKKAGDRYGSAQEIDTDLRPLAAITGSRVARSIASIPAASEAPSVRASGTPTLAWVIAGLSLCAAAAVSYLYITQTPPIPQWRTRPLTAYEGEELAPALSPDGEQVAFIWNEDGSSDYDVYVRLVDGGRPLRLTSTPEEELSVAWSPDSKTIAFTRSDGVYARPTLGGSERQIAPLRVTGSATGNGAGSGLDWSPDGR
jgi:serine/threonine protein kinase